MSGKHESAELREFALAVDRMATAIDELTDLRRGRLSVLYDVTAERRQLHATRDAIAAAQGIAEDVAELVRELERDIAAVRGFTAGEEPRGGR